MRLNKNYKMINIVSKNILVVMSYAVLTALSLILVKMGTAGGVISLQNESISLNVQPAAIFGIITYGVSFLIYMFLISKFSLGYIVPLTTGIVYIIVFTASFFLFEETFSLIKIIAILLILIGAIILNIENSNQ